MSACTTKNAVHRRVNSAPDQHTNVCRLYLGSLTIVLQLATCSAALLHGLFTSQACFIQLTQCSQSLRLEQQQCCMPSLQSYAATQTIGTKQERQGSRYFNGLETSYLHSTRRLSSSIPCTTVCKSTSKVIPTIAAAGMRHGTFHAVLQPFGLLSQLRGAQSSQRGQDCTLYLHL